MSAHDPRNRVIHFGRNRRSTSSEIRIIPEAVESVTGGVLIVGRGQPADCVVGRLRHG